MRQIHAIAKDKAYSKIEDLAQRFEGQKSFYLRAGYNETQTRRDFIDPFFKALGWDMDNENGYAESYREVLHEERLLVEGKSRAPDYAFRLAGGKKLFFVEAKKPSILIREQTEPAYQIRCYGWSAKLPVSVITDFQEFAVYDCTKKPSLSDKAATARLKYLTYTDYLSDFDFLWDTFSRQRVLEGSFDRFVQNDANRKGTSTVDQAFLQSLDSWRTQLAVSISRHNRQLGEEAINYVVQQLIDRIIFLRIAEDRQVEAFGSLRDCIGQGNPYQHLLQLFFKADDKYNSGLFDFSKDRISAQLHIDPKTLKGILSELYFPCPYAFSVLPVEILGTAYEQFLGKQIRVDAAHRVSIEYKPEVRKAGGVYYTPQYVVEYIVKNTLGRLVEGKSPKDIQGLKIVDPACGSGSFLLGAYEFLLGYYREAYARQGRPSKGSKQDQLTPEGYLTTAEKKRILLTHIYGVDLDANAVEVTKLSLLIKCMEGETKASIDTQMRLFHDRVLPTLDHNIRSGNSLIDTDYYAQGPEATEERKIKPFNWQKAFPEVFKAGGFDAVIGNPPWVQSKFIDEVQKSYFAAHYESMSGQYDLFSGFIERSTALLKNSGLFGFIIPNRFLTGLDYEVLRRFLLRRVSLYEIADMGDGVFQDVAMPSALLFFRHRNPTPSTTFCVKTKIVNLATGHYRSHESRQKDHIENRHSNIEIHQNTQEKHIVALMEREPAMREALSNARGVEIGKSSSAIVASRCKHSVPFLTGKDMGRYYMKAPCFLRLGEDGIDYKSPALYEGEKILVRKTGKGIHATLDEQGHYVIQVIYLLKKKAGVNEALAYFLALLNSKLISFYYFKKFGEEDKKVFPHLRQGQLLDIPMKRLNLAQPAHKALHDELVSAVHRILHIHHSELRQAHGLHTEQHRQQLHYFEDSINQLVYQLYGLSADDIALVETQAELNTYGYP